MAWLRRPVRRLHDRLLSWHPKTLRGLVKNKNFRRGYVVVALLVLLGTTLWWSYLSARLQQANADQLVDPYLFQSGATFHGAVFPGQHTFLLKWPLFYLVKLLGYSRWAFLSSTMLAATGTVAGLTFVMYRIERRALVFGTFCLLLASMLLMVPAQPYAGGLLPLNMAMATTRNLEYLLYIAAIGLLASMSRVRSWRFAAGCFLLGVLVVSDRLFLSLSVGGALLAFVAYALVQRWRWVTFSVQWLIAGAGALIFVGLIVLGLHAGHVVGLAASGQNSPYGVVSSLKSFSLGLLYGVGGVLTNFGANPAYDATIVAHIPRALLRGLFSIGGFAYVVNAVGLLTGLWLAARTLWNSLFGTKGKGVRVSQANKLVVALLWSSLAAFVVFVASNHYYAVDARYLTISVFALFVSAALYSRQRAWQPLLVVSSGLIILVAIICGSFAMVHTYRVQRDALKPVAARNSSVAATLSHHHVDTLLGDYWRVLPIKNKTKGSLAVTPLVDCTSPRIDLSSKAWQPDLKHHSFAYLITFDRSLTGYPQCNLQRVQSAYGLPNASALVAGTLGAPKELLLFYDHGEQKNTTQTKQLAQSPGTTLPIKPDQLSHTSCTVPTSMNIVAHQDDDLLFINPDILHDIQGGLCVRTVYVTAGDSGNGKNYWLGREQGSEAAYSAMLHVKDIWIQRTVELAAHEYVTVANPQNNPNISLIFLHLPDGNLRGQGFPGSNFESLAQLDSGEIAKLHTVDGQSNYTATELENALVVLMHTYQPSEIRTQSNYASEQYPDHSDHMAVGRFVSRAYASYEQEQYKGLVPIPLMFYIGYPVHGFAPNIDGDDLANKEEAFLQYAAFDGGVCHNHMQCKYTPTYGSYLSRQYTNPD